MTTDISEEQGFRTGGISQNVRYCNDNPACAEAAKAYRYLPEKLSDEIP
ncbi:hypothetical protein [Endozoicomonas sp. Mp262]